MYTTPTATSESKSELPGTNYASYKQALSAAGAENTDTYSYGSDTWLDLLTAYNGSPITYDAIGNPLTYYNGMSFTWGDGRQLSTLNKADGTQIQYRYDMNGIRTHKTVGGVTTEYIVNGAMILREIKGNTTYSYYYDEAGAPVAMQSGSTIYYFEKNAQGDIVSLRDATGIEVAHLIYDAYGNTVSIDNPQNLHIPFRYRGYYYDADTGFYYLQSRYYDPEIGRFINADDVNYLESSTLGNLFAYCGNNPVMGIDLDGHIVVLNLPQYITDQYGSYKIGDKAMKDISWGWFGNIAANGCGPIAVYNVLESITRTDFYQVKKDLEKFSTPLGFGLLGSDPLSISLYMKTKFNTVYSYIGDRNWGKGVKGRVDGVIIEVFWDNFLEDGAHFFAGVTSYFSNSEWRNYFYFYNSGITGVSSTKAITLSELLGKISAMGATAVYLIVVQGRNWN